MITINLRLQNCVHHNRALLTFVFYYFPKGTENIRIRTTQ